MTNKKKIIDLLKGGEVGVLPTDTLYGLVGSAMCKKAVEKIYELKKRDTSKPLIILIADLSDLKKFNINLTSQAKKFLESVWPGMVSVILPCPHKKFHYLHRGEMALAFRMPDYKELLGLLKASSPLVAPSANLEGDPPAETIKKAKKYFGNRASFYIDGGRLASEPSTLVKITGDKVEILRAGAGIVPKVDSFKSRVLKIVSGIPVGKVMTYKQVAIAAGSSKAYKAVGNILGQNHDPRVPCHRVIKSDGALGGYNMGQEIKRELLEGEGINFGHGNFILDKIEESGFNDILRND